MQNSSGSPLVCGRRQQRGLPDNHCGEPFVAGTNKAAIKTATKSEDKMKRS